MAKEIEITKENLRKMVVLFYTKILKDDVVGPFFIERLGDDLTSEKWVAHLDLLTNFWAGMTLGEFDYRGNPFAPHATMQGLEKETFSRWLELFFDTVDTIYDEKVANQFKQRGVTIAGNFMRNLGLA